MGKVMDALRGAGITTDLQKHAKMLALDTDFSEMEAKVKRLEVQILKLEAQVNPLERENERYKQQLEQQNAPNVGNKLDEISTQILITIANNEIPKDRIIRHLSLSQAKGDYQFDILREQKLIAISYAGQDGAVYRATSEGRAYLAKNNLL